MKNETDVTIILDRSGSMDAISTDVVGGFNQFLAAQQREPGDCRLTLVQFDNVYETVYAGVSVADAPKLTAKTFVPRGSTALLDAIGRTIDGTGRRLSALPEAARPERVLIVIVTDGFENASTDYSRQRVFEMITTQRDVYKWTFLFLAANQDAIEAGEGIGVGAGHALSWKATGAGVAAASLAMSEAVSMFRSTGDASVSATVKKPKKKVH